jgi:hypothetical protein
MAHNSPEYHERYRLGESESASGGIYRRRAAHISKSNRLPFSELKQQSPINERVRAADDDPDFSRAIREGASGRLATLENESRIFNLHIPPGD